MNRIVCAAVFMHDGTIVTGVRHLSPDMRHILRKAYGMNYQSQVEKEGFIDNKGSFHDRKAAWSVALNAGQILRNTGTDGELYSENLY